MLPLWILGIGSAAFLWINAEKRKVKRVFISFDYDNDKFLRTALIAQAKNPKTMFSISDRSVKAHLTGEWKTKVRGRISRSDLVMIICGQFTHTADGVAEELKICQELGKPYYLIKGYRDKRCKKPITAKKQDEMIDWTWSNFEKILL